MFSSLLLVSNLALAGSDVGTDGNTFGLGVVFGDPYIGVTGKFWLNEKSGISFYAGTAFLYHSVRGSFQSNFVTVGEEWSFGQLPIYWHVDVDAGAWTVTGGLYPRVRAGGGAGVAFQFDAVPAEAFVEVGLMAGYNGYYCGTAYLGLGALCYVGPLYAAGGRWYF